MRNAPLILLAGPTAVGKSEIALCLAEKLNGEIVSVDSMQVYRGLDVGAAKPTPNERERIRHHLIDLVDLTHSFDAAQFARLAHSAVNEIRARGRVPILCGGTGFYFKVFLHGIGEAPPAAATLRSQLEATPLSELLAELAANDPKTFERIDKQNPRRVIRAVEVLRLTGKPCSEQRASWTTRMAQPGDTISTALLTHLFIGLSRSSADLQRRINQRVDKMFANGLVAETEKLLQQGLAENQTAMQALGYRQVVEHLRGIHSLPATIELVKIRTRQFAKRQMTWFKKYGPSHWINLSIQRALDSTPDETIRRLYRELSDCTHASA
ncbi:MAG TPA: tRNA (adenosine(37)-N6)-dimethylallyltransferase MiaA [Verrucomicrobiae bacterium]|jgi:tRNA dimethylallyltransferase